MKRKLELRARVHEADDGTYWAEVEELPGCFASGHTFAELVECLEDAVAMYLQKESEEAPASCRVATQAPHEIRLIAS